MNGTSLNQQSTYDVLAQKVGILAEKKVDVIAAKKMYYTLAKITK